MKTVLFATLLILITTQSFADNKNCNGRDELHEVTINYGLSEIVVDDISMYDYTVAISDLKTAQKVTEITFQGAPLVFDRGMTGVARVPEFYTLKIIFDGVRAVAMYTLSGDNQSHQVPLQCNVN